MPKIPGIMPEFLVCLSYYAASNAGIFRLALRQDAAAEVPALPPGVVLLRRLRGRSLRLPRRGTPPPPRHLPAPLRPTRLR